MKVIFMGTPDFAVPTLRELVKSGANVVLAVTQPDRPKGRGGKMSQSPVKETALEYGIPVYQPDRIRRPEHIAYLRQFEADVIVVVAFGQILPKEILEMPKYGCVNVHASLLPKFRGAAPIQWAVLSGEKVSGVTTMKMDETLDTGDIILQKEVALDEDETSGSLFDKLSTVGAELLVETLKELEQGTAVFTKQDDAIATYTKMIKKEQGQIDFTKPAAEIDCLVRGMAPWPSAFTTCRGKMLKIWKAKPLSGQDFASRFGKEISIFQPGQVAAVTKKELAVCAGEGTALLVEELQLAGKKRMAADAFLRGVQLREGEQLGG